jgi:hypothetical protein
LITSIAIIAVSCGLFLYWFRYSCLLILNAKTTRDYAQDVATANRLNFLDVQQALAGSANGAGLEMDRLHAALRSDYEIVTLLAGEALRGGRDRSLEEAMLKFDYQAMQACYKVARFVAPARALSALNEMSEIVMYFANSMGQRSVAAAEL